MPYKPERRAAEYLRRRDHILAVSRAWHAKNRDRVRERKLIAKYGITLVDFAAFLERQGGVCGICKTADPGGTPFHVDHDHATGRIRGILCNNCNRGLGHFQDDPERCESAARYLRGTK